MYLLPVDAGKFQLSYTETSGANSVMMNNPFEVKVKIKYDAATNSLNGVISSFHFTPPTNILQSLVLNGTFIHSHNIFASYDAFYGAPAVVMALCLSGTLLVRKYTSWIFNEKDCISGAI